MQTDEEPPGPGPSAYVRRERATSTRPRVRPYPEPPDESPEAVLLAATRALLHASDEDVVLQVLTTAVEDLGGQVVAAADGIVPLAPLDVSLGITEPLVVAAEPAGVPAMHLRRVLPVLLDDARAALSRWAPQPAVRRAGSLPPDLAGELPAFLDLLSVADRAGAQLLVQQALRLGADATAVVEELLAPAEHEVGERWYGRHWSTADEHAATAVVDACGLALPQDAGPLHVVLACPDGEWHALPARLAALSARKIRVTVLGPGLPAEDVLRYLDAVRPDALGLSCTSVPALLQAVDTVRAAHSAGVPVLAGGRAFGSAPHRSIAIGADGWSRSARNLAELVPLLEIGADVQVPHEAMLAAALDERVVALAVDRQAAASLRAQSLNAWQRMTLREDLVELAQHAAAAVLCGDPSLVDEQLTWLVARPRDDGIPGAVIHDALLYLADAVEPDAPTAARLLRASHERSATSD